MKTASKKRSNSKEEDGELKVNWTDYITKIYELATAIQRSKIKFDYVYGIPRGGLIPATILSHELNIKMLDDLIPMEYENRNILLVDDVCDSGKVLSQYIDEIGINRVDCKWKPKCVKTAVIYQHEKSEFIPDFFVTVNAIWVKFPYEKN